MGKMGDKSSGPRGFLLAGLRGGLGRFGMSAWMLYHRVGMSFSSSRILVGSFNLLSPLLDFL
ncbi:hypothetical protein KKC1_05220 [Calderihabitans maritimus]|uniref:Uncharacterized protein n=1 Tax=Calderihabitans maritimus TaxID=1246530 RepID=A0A1Z5HQ11_9FIRM|nr:hypothetical protein KKC1_05220 [Calderihabitans maritimus]